MERIVYIRGKFRGTNKEMKEAYFYAKEMMRKYERVCRTRDRRNM